MSKLALSTNHLTYNHGANSEACEVVVNEDGSDVNFRIETDGNENGLLVDASTDRVGILNSAPATTLDITGALTASGVAIFGAANFNEAGTATIDFRVEGDTMENAFFIDASAELVLFSDAATGGTAPTAPTGGYTTTGGIFVVIQNNTATSDAAILSLVGGTAGTCGVEFGDSGDANIGNISYGHTANTFTITANTANAMTIGGNAVGIVINEAGVADFDVRMEGDTDANLFFLDGSVDAIGIGTSTPSTNVMLDVVGAVAFRTANLAVANGDNNNNLTTPAATLLTTTSASAAFTLNGLTLGADGRFLVIFNNLAQDMTIANDAGASTAANRFLTQGATAVTTGLGVFTAIYSSVQSRWMLISAAG